MEGNYLYELLEVEELVEASEGDPDSELCSSCGYTDYGTESNSGQTNGGHWSCEGSGCDEARESLEDNLRDVYNNRKGELGMGDTKMKVEIDLSVLEQNIVKMVSDKLEENVSAQMTSKLSKSIEEKVTAKTNEMIEDKISRITEMDIYNIKINNGEEEVCLFEHLVKRLILKANESSMKFDKTIEELIESVSFEKVDGNFKDDEFKVLTSYGENKYGETDSMEISINGKRVFNLGEGEPEDMTFNRDLNNTLHIPDLIREAYLAGKDGKIMYEASEVKNDE